MTRTKHRWYLLNEGGFLHKCECAQFHRLLPVGFFSLPSHHHDAWGPWNGHQILKELQPVLLRHGDIQEDDIELFPLYPLKHVQGVVLRCHRRHFIHDAQPLDCQGTEENVVIHNEDRQTLLFNRRSVGRRVHNNETTYSCS